MAAHGLTVEMESTHRCTPFWQLLQKLAQLSNAQLLLASNHFGPAGQLARGGEGGSASAVDCAAVALVMNTTA
jgi:hypothetical protein